MTNLTAAAQAVLDAANKGFWRSPLNSEGNGAAAALRAAAEHCVPDDSEGYWVYIPHVLAIAAELEAYQ